MLLGQRRVLRHRTGSDHVSQATTLQPIQGTSTGSVFTSDRSHCGCMVLFAWWALFAVLLQPQGTPTASRRCTAGTGANLQCPTAQAEPESGRAALGNALGGPCLKLRIYWRPPPNGMQMQLQIGHVV